MSKYLKIAAVSLLLPYFAIAADEFTVVDSFPLNAGSTEITAITGDTIITICNSEYRMYRLDNLLKSQDDKHPATPIKSGNTQSFDAIKAVKGKLYLMSLKDETIYESKNNLLSEIPVCKLDAVLTNDEKKQGEKLAKCFASDGTDFYFVVLAGWSSKILKFNPLSGKSESLGNIEGIPGGLDYFDNKVWYLGCKSAPNSKPLLLEYSIPIKSAPLHRTEIPCNDAKNLVVNKDGVWVTARDFVHHIVKK